MMKLFDGNWNFDPSMYIVCSRFYKDPLMFMERKEWVSLNRQLRAQGDPEYIEYLKR